jgi:hypothetical protein
MCVTIPVFVNNGGKRLVAVQAIEVNFSESLQRFFYDSEEKPLQRFAEILHVADTRMHTNGNETRCGYPQRNLFQVPA